MHHYSTVRCPRFVFNVRSIIDQSVVFNTVQNCFSTFHLFDFIINLKNIVFKMDIDKKSFSMRDCYHSFLCHADFYNGEQQQERAGCAGSKQKHRPTDRRGAWTSPEGDPTANIRWVDSPVEKIKLCNVAKWISTQESEVSFDLINQSRFSSLPSRWRCGYFWSIHNGAMNRKGIRPLQIVNSASKSESWLMCHRLAIISIRSRKYSTFTVFLVFVFSANI